MKNLSGECVFIVVLFALGCTSSRQWADPNITQKTVSVDGVKKYGGTKAVIRVTFTDKKNEEQTVEGSLLKDPDSPDVLMIMTSQNTTQTKILAVPVAQVKEIVLLTLQHSAFTDGEFNSFAREKKARVVYKNRMVANVHNIALAGDSLSWNEGLSQKRVHVSEINYVSFTNHALGALEGLGIGLLIGEVVGAIVYSSGPKDEFAGLNFIVWPALFGPIGLVAGVAAGSHTEYLFAGK